MGKIQPTSVAINGTTLGKGTAQFLDPVYLFKGKLRAAATRSKFHDSADLRWLEGRFRQIISAKKGEMNLQYVGLAMKRYPELETLFTRLGLDVTKAKSVTSGMDLKKLPQAAPGDVQVGILG